VELPGIVAAVAQGEAFEVDLAAGGVYPMLERMARAGLLPRR
jgi:hypothetical protein